MRGAAETLLLLSKVENKMNNLTAQSDIELNSAKRWTEPKLEIVEMDTTAGATLPQMPENSVLTDFTPS